MRFSRTAAYGAALLAAALVIPGRGGAQDAPPPAPGPETPPAPEKEPPAAPKPAAAEKAPALAPPAGLLLVPGGKVRIGMVRNGDKKNWGFRELIAWSVLGRTPGVEQSIEAELSPTVGEFEVVLASFFIGKYEVTNAQYHHFLRQTGRVEVVVPQKDRPGARTLDAISKEFLLQPKIQDRGGKWIFPVAVDWEGLYDLNEGTLNPVRAAGEKRPPREAFQNLPLPPGAKILAYRYTVPGTWRVKGKTEEGREKKSLRDAPLPGTGDHPVTGISLVDAVACAEFFGCHVPTEIQWEAAARGPKGEPWPTGEFEPLGMAWSGFNTQLQLAQEEAKKKLAKHEEALRKNPGNGGTLSPEEKARCEWIVGAKEIEDPNNLEIPTYPVGLFPFGKAPSGAMDLLGNADEWVSTPLFPYPGTDSKSVWLQAKSQIFRGGNALDRDIFLCATIRKTLIHQNPLPAYARYATGGFRMARYPMPGASAASHAAQTAVDLNRDLPILPGEIDAKTRMPVFVGLAIEQAAGIELLNEVAWDAAASPASDPTGKVFHLGRAYSLCLVPADGVPFRDIGALRKAADRPVTDPESGKGETREPRDIPFFGLLHMTEGMEIKGEVHASTWKEVPLQGDDLKRAKEAWELAHKMWEERKKAAEEAAKAEEDAKKDGKKEDPPPPEDGKKMDGPSALLVSPKGGDKKKKGGTEAPPPPPEGGKPEEHKPDDAPAEEPEEPEADPDPEPVMVTTKKVSVASYGPGFLKGADHPEGLFLGMVQWQQEKRAVLWEARVGGVGTSAPGGSVLLEPPLVILPKDCLEFKKVARPGTPFSKFDTTSGDVELGFYIPVEGKSDWYEFRLKLQAAEFPAGNPASPWRATILTAGEKKPDESPPEKKPQEIPPK